jgi:mRNA-degrading endonuclease RelE of RelBE toxin-antitoxin system
VDLESSGDVEIVFTTEARRHFAHLTAHEKALVRDRVLVQLGEEPAIETRNRNRLRPNRLATYRLRVGDLRVYYEVLEEPERVALVKAIGRKVRDRVLIGGEEVDLS